jgi:hypothetical protein
MDACDKAAKLLQCGKENAPEAMNALMTSFENELNNVCLFVFLSRFKLEII